MPNCIPYLQISLCAVFATETSMGAVPLRYRCSYAGQLNASFVNSRAVISVGGLDYSRRINIRKSIEFMCVNKTICCKELRFGS
jgi:hypothetical protein